MHPAVTNGSYDVRRVREDFPILAMQVHGKPLVYLDNAASAQKPKAVLDRLTQAYTSEYSNVHRGMHYLANAATEGYEGAREKVCPLSECRTKRGNHFHPGGQRRRSISSPRHSDANGSALVTKSCSRSWSIMPISFPGTFLRERQGAVIKWAPVDDEGNFLIDEFEKLLSDRTKMVAITQMSNVLGTVVPVKEVVRIAHARGIPVLVDGAQSSVHLDVDVQDIDCDFYVVTGHKLYGPTGIGALYGKYEHLAAMPPFNGGGEMIREVHQDNVTYGQPPHRVRSRNPCDRQAIGLGAAIDYINSIGKSRIRAHESSLLAYANEKLREINSLRIIGNAAGKGAILSFEMRSAHAHDFATVLDRAGVAVRAGTHCAMPLLERFGVTATCRASFALYNTHEEVDVLAQALTKAQEFFA